MLATWIRRTESSIWIHAFAQLDALKKSCMTKSTRPCLRHSPCSWSPDSRSAINSVITANCSHVTTAGIMNELHVVYGSSTKPSPTRTWTDQTPLVPVLPSVSYLSRAIPCGQSGEAVLWPVGNGQGRPSGRVTSAELCKLFSRHRFLFLLSSYTLR